jgi:spermidine synthase
VITADHPPGELVHRHDDEIGPVCVFQRDRQRFLSFGNAVEQSCLDLLRPYRLEHAYTQAMMLSLLLYPAAARTLVLGLGGGSLVRALQHARPNMRIEAVEFRQAVIDVARDFFELRDNDRLRVHCMDAQDFVRSATQRQDLLMLDLYLAEGADPVQTQVDFLSRCRDLLSEQGILMANHWCSEYRDSQLAQAALREVFGDSLLYLQVQGGNTIAFAFAGELPRIDPKQLFAQAQALGSQLAIPLQGLARNFWRQNAQPLRIGRFARGR